MIFAFIVTAWKYFTMVLHLPFLSIEIDVHSIRRKYRSLVPGAHNPKGRGIELVIPPVVEWHLQENSIYGMLSSYARLVYYWTSAK